jgi:hypothetical protein
MVPQYLTVDASFSCQVPDRALQIMREHETGVWTGRTHSKNGICLRIICETHGLLEVESTTCDSFFWAWYDGCSMILHCQSLSQGIILSCKQERSTTISIINSRRIFTCLSVSSIALHDFPFPSHWRMQLCFLDVISDHRKKRYITLT